MGLDLKDGQMLTGAPGNAGEFFFGSIAFYNLRTLRIVANVAVIAGRARCAVSLSAIVDDRSTGASNIFKALVYRAAHALLRRSIR